MTSLGSTILRKHLDGVPLWRGDHVVVKQLAEDFARYLYLPRVAGSEVLVQAIRDGVALLTWPTDTFAYAESYDEGAARYRGLRAGQSVTLSAESAGLLVKPDLARRQMDAETTVQPPVRTPGDENSAGAAGDTRSTKPAAGAAPIAAPAPRPKRFHGTVRLDSARVGRDASRIADEVIAHLAGQVGERVGKSVSGVRRTMREDMNSRLEYTISAERLLDEVALKQQIRAGSRHYVYVLCRPDGQPFYVGKGVDNRVLQHSAEARTTKRLSHKLNVIRVIHRSGSALSYVLDSFHDDEKEALARERYLIQSIGRHDLKKGPLTNQTEGGEGVSNPSEESRERRRQTLWGDQSDDPDRQLANRFFQKICDVESVPIKPVGRYKIEGLWRNRATISMMPRQAAALVASAIANRVMLCAGALIPRRMTVDGVPMIVENGVGRDTLSSDMTTLEGGAVGAEVLRLTDAGFRFISREIDWDLMLDAGVVEPKGQPQ